MQYVINKLLKLVADVSRSNKDFKIQNAGFKCRDIVVIAKTQEAKYVNLKYIIERVKPTLCTIQQYQEGKNAIPICYSKDVASLEWPVVIHLQWSKKRIVDGKDFLTGDISLGEEDNVIPSRCMVQYILICREDDKIPEGHFQLRGGDDCPKSIKGYANLADLFDSGVDFKNSDF